MEPREVRVRCAARTDTQPPLALVHADEAPPHAELVAPPLVLQLAGCGHTAGLGAVGGILDVATIARDASLCAAARGWAPILPLLEARLARHCIADAAVGALPPHIANTVPAILVAGAVAAAVLACVTRDAFEVGPFAYAIVVGLT